MKILVCWFSKTGTTKLLALEAAGRLGQAGHDVRSSALCPRLDLPYALWLGLSFFPGSQFPLRTPVPDPSGFDACLLALPKWTFSCPPVNAFLSRQPRPLPPTALLVTFGGWDQERYAAALARRVEARGTRVLGTMLAKKGRVLEGTCREELASFLGRCFAPEGVRSGT